MPALRVQIPQVRRWPNMDQYAGQVDIYISYATKKTLPPECAELKKAERESKGTASSRKRTATDGSNVGTKAARMA